MEKLIVGCHDTNWAELEPHLHNYVKERLLGRFSIDVASATCDEVRERAVRIFHESLDCRRHELVHLAVSQARGHRRGVTGLRRVLRALELGEVQTLLVVKLFRAGGRVHQVRTSRLPHRPLLFGLWQLYSED